MTDDIMLKKFRENKFYEELGHCGSACQGDHRTPAPSFSSLLPGHCEVTASSASCSPP
jgi:hypothetical protein